VGTVWEVTPPLARRKQPNETLVDVVLELETSSTTRYDHGREIL